MDRVLGGDDRLTDQYWITGTSCSNCVSRGDGGNGGVCGSGGELLQGTVAEGDSGGDSGTVYWHRLGRVDWANCKGEESSNAFNDCSLITAHKYAVP